MMTDVIVRCICLGFHIGVYTFQQLCFRGSPYLSHSIEQANQKMPIVPIQWLIVGPPGFLLLSH